MRSVLAKVATASFFSGANVELRRPRGLHLAPYGLNKLNLLFSVLSAPKASLFSPPGFHESNYFLNPLPLLFYLFYF